MTDKLRAAAEMALEALEAEIEFPKTGPALTMMKDSVEALRQALAEPPNSTTNVVEPEPVVWGMQNSFGQITDVITPDEHDRVEGAYTVPLYTAPPKREWQGLTDEEVDNLLGNMSLGSVDEDVRLIEAKLKEKNT